MDKTLPKLSDNEVRKPSGAIHASNKFTLVQGKAMNVLLKNALPELKEKETHTISMYRLMKDIGFSSRNTKDFKESLRGLISTVVEWNVLGKDNKHEWAASSVLASAKINAKGILEYSYSPHLKELFANQYLYAKLNLLIQKSFTKKHSLKLWETFVDALCVAKLDEAFTPWISLEQYRKLMGLAEGEHTEFKMLNNRVIKEPLKEINDVSDVEGNVEYKKDGRRCIAVRFFVRKKAFYQEKPAGPVLVQEEPTPTTSKSQLAKKRLIDEFGLSPKVAQEHIQSLSLETIEKTMEIVKRQRDEGKEIRNIPAYINSALQGQWVFPEMVEEERHKKNSKEDKKIEDDITHQGWKNVRKKLKAYYGEDVFRSWLRDARFVEIKENTVILEVKTRFIAKRIEDNYLATIKRMWQEENDKVTYIVIKIKMI